MVLALVTAVTVVYVTDQQGKMTWAPSMVRAGAGEVELVPSSMHPPLMPVGSAQDCTTPPPVELISSKNP